jgi:hypothetical protein
MGIQILRRFSKYVFVIATTVEPSASPTTSQSTSPRRKGLHMAKAFRHATKYATTTPYTGTATPVHGKAPPHMARLPRPTEGRSFRYNPTQHGEMAEWLKAAVC